MTQRVSPEQIYQEVNNAVSNAIYQQGAGVTGLGKAVAVSTSSPITTFYDLITKFPTLNSQMIDKAVKAFKDTTGLDPATLTVSSVQTTSSAKQIGKQIINFNAFYIFFPVGLVFFIGIWLMMGFGWFDWAVAIYLSFLLILIIYTFDVMYRIHAQHAIDNVVDEETTTVSTSEETTQNMKTFIAYLPQLVHAIGTALSSSS